MLSIYLLMFSLGSMTRYSLGDFDDLFESGYGPFFDTFLLASPVRRPAITGREIYNRPGFAPWLDFRMPMGGPSTAAGHGLHSSAGYFYA
jgi:hypothetical protein